MSRRVVALRPGPVRPILNNLLYFCDLSLNVSLGGETSVQGPDLLTSGPRPAPRLLVLSCPGLFGPGSGLFGPGLALCLCGSTAGAGWTGG